MHEEQLIELQKELKEALQAIDILTNRLMDLAVVENKFLQQTESLRHMEIICAGIAANVAKTEERINANLSESRDYFNFRYKWMKKLFIKNNLWWR